MVILKTSVSGHGAGWAVALMFLFIVLGVFVCLLIEGLSEKSKELIEAIIIVAFVIIILIVIIIHLAQTKYYLYPNGTSIEEIETEYDIVCVDGLIVQGFKKGEKK